MAEFSKSELEAAVAAMTRDQSGTAQSERAQRVEFSALRRTYHERLRSELAEMGFDFSRLERLSTDFKEEARKLRDRQMPSADSKPAKPTISDQELIDNQKRVYELIGDRPLVTSQVVVDTATFIFGAPGGALIDSQLAPLNNWAEWAFGFTHDGDFLSDDWSLHFFFYWRNDSPNDVVIKTASAGLLTSGSVTVVAFGHIFQYSAVRASLFANLRVQGSGPIVDSGGAVLVNNLFADTTFYGGGSENSRTLDQFDRLTCHDIVVPAERTANIDVKISGFNSIDGDGFLNYLFPRFLCPSVVLEVLS
jgi:hypothetical protein